MKKKKTNLETKKGIPADFKEIDNLELYADVNEGLKLLGLIELFRVSKRYEVNSEIILQDNNWGFFENTIFDREKENFFVVEIALPQEYFTI